MDIRRATRRSRFLTGLLVAAVVAVVGLVVTIRVEDLHLQTVLTGSMRPTASPGDVAVTQGVLIGSLRVGDVIAFYPPGQTTPVLHRIRSLNATPAGMEITTRGDANSVDDPWRATLQGTTAYRLVAVVPFIGWLTELQRPVLLAAGLLLGLAVLLELRKEVKARGMKSQSPPPES
jgi:signal peptidase I